MFRKIWTENLYFFNPTASMTDLFFRQTAMLSPTVLLKKNFILVTIPISSLCQPSLSPCLGRGVPDAPPMPRGPDAGTVATFLSWYQFFGIHTDGPLTMGRW